MSAMGNLMYKSRGLHQRRESLHFADEPVLVDWPPLLSTRNSRSFRPHFLHVLQDHIAMSIEGLDPGEQFAVVAAGYENLRMRSDGGLENREGPRGEFMLFELGDLILASRLLAACS